MNSRRALLLGTALAAALAGLGARGQTAVRAAPARIELAGTVRLEGSGPGVFPVHLSQPVALTAFGGRQGPDVTIEGNGRSVGFVLHQDGGWNTIIASLIKDNFCPTPGCEASVPSADGGFYDPRSGVAMKGTLPAGDYHLYLIADVAPAVVTLHLHGLSGSLVLRPAGPAPVTVLTAPTTLALPPVATGPVDYAAGTVRTQTGGGVTSIVMWADQPLPDEVTSSGACAYDGPPPATFPAYNYPCRGAVCCRGFVGGNFQIGRKGGILGLTGEYRSFEQDGVLESPGSYGVGGSIQSAGPVDDAHLVETWVDFADTTSIGPQSPSATTGRGIQGRRSLPNTSSSGPSDSGFALAVLGAFTIWLVGGRRRRVVAPPPS